jgi:hypothetical protein
MPLRWVGVAVVGCVVDASKLGLSVSVRQIIWEL